MSWSPRPAARRSRHHGVRNKRDGGRPFFVRRNCDERNHVQRKGFSTKQIEGRALDLTVSVGLAKHPEDGTNTEEIQARAEEALFQARSRGRNSIGAYFLRYIHAEADFLKGGNRVEWWVAGLASFMSGFSVWTFSETRRSPRS